MGNNWGNAMDDYYGQSKCHSETTTTTSMNGDNHKSTTQVNNMPNPDLNLKPVEEKTDPLLPKYAACGIDGNKKSNSVEDIVLKGAHNPVTDVKYEKHLIMKNIILISLAFLLNFTAYQGLARLQSSLHRDEGMGVINQSILYTFLVISCFFLPKLMVSFIGHKWAIPVSICGYITWMAANGYAVWGTMIPTSILVGLTAAPLWTAQCSYFTIVGARYATLTGETEQTIITRFFGIFFCFFQMSNITGSIISSAVLTPKDKNYVADEWVLQFCGRNTCPGDNITLSGLNDPSKTTVWIMVGTYMGVAALAVILVSVFVDPLPDRYTKRGKVHLSDIQGLITASAKHLRHKEQLLLIPLTIYSGLEQAFYGAEFSASFVTCSLGIWKVGLVTLGFGVVNATVSLVSGRVVKYTGMLPVFTAGLVVDIVIQITLLTWLPHPNEEYALYILACMWGFTDGIWQTQINAFYGILFVTEPEAAFANYRIWESLGFIIGFAYSSVLCTHVKTYIIMSMLVLGYTGFLWIQYGQFKAKGKK